MSDDISYLRIPRNDLELSSRRVEVKDTVRIFRLMGTAGENGEDVPCVEFVHIHKLRQKLREQAVIGMVAKGKKRGKLFFLDIELVGDVFIPGSRLPEATGSLCIPTSFVSGS